MEIKRRALSLMLSLAIVLTFMPALAFAGALPEETVGAEWSITNEETSFFMEGDSQVLQVTTTLDDTGAALSYQWYTGDDNDDTGMDWTVIEGETGSSYTATSRGFYACAVTSNKKTLVIPFTVLQEYDDEEPDTSIDWYIDYDGESFLKNGKATLKVMPNYYGEGTPEYIYQWFELKYDKASDEWTETEIAGATAASYTAAKGGEYRCDVTIKVNGEEDSRSAYFTVYSWKILNNEEDIPVEYGKSVTLTVETDYTGTDMTYQWCRYEYDPESGDDKKVAIEGATNKSYTINNVTDGDNLYCVVEAEGQEQEASFYIYVDTSNYDYQVTYPDATATYKTVDGRDLTFKYDEHRVWSYNYPWPGDTITVKYDNNKTTVYTCNDEDGEYFESESGEKLNFERDDVKVMDAPAQKEWVYTDSVINHNEKRIDTKFDFEIEMPIKVISHVKSIKFEPERISLSPEDVKVTDEYGDFWYSFSERSEYTDEDGDTYNSPWADGDKLTVEYTRGGSRVYTFDSKKNAFVWSYGGNTLHAYPTTLNDNLSQGSNKIKVWFDGLTTDVEVYLGGTPTPTPTPSPTPAPTPAPSVDPVTPAPAAGAAEGETVKAADGSTVKVTSNTADTVAYTKAKNAKSVTVPATVSLNGKTYKVTEVSANAFKGTKAKTVTIGKNVKTIKAKAFSGSKVTTLNVKSKSLTKKSVKGSLKGSKVKTVKVKVGSKAQNKKYVKKYKKIFTKANAGKKVSVK